MSWPARVMVPADGASTCASTCSSVDLPHPLGPASVSQPPAGTEKVTPATASRSAPSWRTRTPSQWTELSGAAGAATSATAVAGAATVTSCGPEGACVGACAGTGRDSLTGFTGPPSQPG